MIGAYHGSLAHAPNGFLSHFGSFAAASRRLESIFSINVRVYVDNKFLVLSPTGEMLRTETMDEYIRSLASHMKNSHIHRADLNIRNPLRLTDCWEIDPIGSGGMQLFSADANLTMAQIKDLKNVFYPFDGIIYPDDINRFCSPAHIHFMTQELEKSELFQNDLSKRRQAMGEKHFSATAAYETVWVYMTKKLYDWSTKNGFDGFVYNNAEETSSNAGPEDSFVTFDKSQVKLTGIYRFCPDTFWNSVAPTIEKGFEKLLDGKESKQIRFNYADQAWDDAIMGCWLPDSNGVGNLATAQKTDLRLKS